MVRARALLASQIIRVLDSRALSARGTERLMGVTYSEFSRIRNAKLSRFTLDRLIGILGKLDETVEVKVSFSPHRGATVIQQAL